MHMTEKRITETFAHGRISYPRLEADAENKTAATMNGFYLALRDAAAAYMEEIAHSPDGTSRTYTADYILRQDENTVTVEYTLRLRRRGRIEAQKTLVHTWKNGYLLPPEKKKHRPPRQKRKTCLKPAAKDDII
jgi:hypothetical protein